jgi:hypothetical protein
MLVAAVLLLQAPRFRGQVHALLARKRSSP